LDRTGTPGCRRLRDEWFVANDAPNFGLVQIAVGLLLLSLVVSVIAFWPSSWTVKFNRFGKKN
jgi:hypothetical protein